MIALTLVLTYTALFQQSPPTAVVMLGNGTPSCAATEAYVNFASVKRFLWKACKDTVSHSQNSKDAACCHD